VRRTIMSESGMEIAPATSELALRLRQQELVAAFGLFALREDRLEAALQQACETAARGLEARFSKVLVFRPESQDMLLAHGMGWAPGVIGNVVLGADLASPAGYALRTKLPVVTNHLAQEDRFRTPAVLAEHGILRAINVIIDGENGQPFGVLEVDSTDRLDFTDHDTAFLQSLANVLSAAVERCARLEYQAALLREKDLLMQEVHHRVKNSLQLVQTMLQLQARGIPEGDERERLQDAASRIMTIAAVHRRLHQQGGIEGTDAAGYLRGLMGDLGTSLTPDTALRPIDVEAEPIVLSADRITPLGLIATELVTNALKYGDGRVLVAAKASEGGVVVTVEDEGRGFPADFDPASGGSLGMRLVAALARGANAISIDRSVPFGRITVQVAFAPG
jgi:two-component sensor histidine kinase